MQAERVTTMRLKDELKQKDKEIKQYVKERDEMLLKCSADELRKFAKKYEHILRKGYLESFLNAPDMVVEITLHKMIVNCINLPFDFRQKSADWLLDRGFRLELWGGDDE